jgi:small neutral amino acid transporter SnatA (MarC family)
VHPNLPPETKADLIRADRGTIMKPYSLIEILTLIFVTMGPIKPLVTFAEKTAGLEPALRRRIAFKAVSVATIVGLLFIFFGNVLMKVFKFSATATSLEG